MFWQSVHCTQATLLEQHDEAEKSENWKPAKMPKPQKIFLGKNENHPMAFMRLSPCLIYTGDSFVMFEENLQCTKVSSLQQHQSTERAQPDENWKQTSQNHKTGRMRITHWPVDDIRHVLNIYTGYFVMMKRKRESDEQQRENENQNQPQNRKNENHPMAFLQD